MNFCKMCGTSLVVATPPPAAAAADGKVPCGACGKQTPSGFAFCQHCGQKLGATVGPPGLDKPVVGDKKAAVAATMVAEPPISTPPAGMPRASVLKTGLGDAFASTIGPAAVAPVLEQLARGAGTGSGMSTIKTSPLRPEPIVEMRTLATLVVVRRDGSDGESVRITAPTFDVGRTEGGLTFADDIYLAARHLRLSFENGGASARSLDNVNGVYVRLRAAVELHPGDQFLVGKELIRYEQVGADDREPLVSEHGVRLFGTVPREAWGRLRQISAAGTTRDVWHLARPDLVLGREEGDVTFPDDEFMSRRHAAVRRGTPRPKLEDLSSSNGTFVRLRGDHALHTGDLLRLGDQLLRVEI